MRKKTNILKNMMYGLILSMCIISPTISVAAENQYSEQESQIESYDDVYTGDDSYYAEENDQNADIEDYYSQSGTPYEAGSIAGEQYHTWESPVIIETANTDIVVKENNTYDVVKTIKVYYNTENGHNINLYVTRNNFVSTSSDIIEGLSVTSTSQTTKYKMMTNTNEYVIKIEDGTQGRTYCDYVISYTYVSRGDENKKEDVFAQDLLGFRDIPVRKTNFSIVMPKQYSKKDLSIKDYEGSNLNMLPSLSETQISGYVDSQLNGVLDVTLKVEDGYFNSTTIPIWLKLLLSIISMMSILSVLFGFALAGISYYQFGMSEKPEIIPQRKPMENITPVDIIVTLSGGATNEDLMLYALHLANEGYIKIQDTTYRHHKNRDIGKGYRLIKQKEYDGKDKYMRQFMRILFSKSDNVRPCDLSKTTYSKLDNLRLRMQKEGIRELWDIDEGRRKLCHNIGVLIPLLSSLLLSMYNIDVGLSIHTFSFLYGPIMAIIIDISIKKIDAMIKKRNVMRGGVADIMTWIYVFGSSFIILLVIGTANNTMFIKHSLLMTMSYFAEIILIYCSCNMKKRTPEGVKMCGKILGFRQFMMEAKELDIKKAVLKDEQYIYKSLPFAISMGLATDGWLAQMDGCKIDEPSWYSSSSDSEFRLVEFMEDWPIIVETILETGDEYEE